MLLLPPGALAVRRLGRGLNAPGHLFLRLVRPWLRPRLVQPRLVQPWLVRLWLGAHTAAAWCARASRRTAWSVKTGTKLSSVPSRNRIAGRRKVGVSLGRYLADRVVARAAEIPVASLATGVATPSVPEPPWRSIGSPQTRPGVRGPGQLFGRCREPRRPPG